MGTGEGRDYNNISPSTILSSCQLFCCWTFYRALVNVFINWWNISPGQENLPPPPSSRPKFSRPYLKSCLCLRGSEQGQIGWWLDTIHWSHLSGNMIAPHPAICWPALPPILLLTNDYARTEEEERRWQLSCLPGGGCRETDKNTIKSSRYVYAFSFPRYNRFRRITCKNFCTVLQSYVTLQFPILVNNHQH